MRAREHTTSVEEVEGELTPLAMPELRTGEWTRFGSTSVLGDLVTEETLSTLAARTRTAAQSQGYAVGWADGQRAAREEARRLAKVVAAERAESEQRREAEHSAAVAALQLAATQLRDTIAGLSAAVEEQATDLAFELTRELVGHELRSVTGPEVVRRALELVPTEPVARVRLHADQVAELAAADLAELAERGVAVVADPSLSWGDALVEADDHVIDARLGTALARVREVLA